MRSVCRTHCRLLHRARPAGAAAVLPIGHPHFCAVLPPYGGQRLPQRLSGRGGVLRTGGAYLRRAGICAPGGQPVPPHPSLRRGGRLVGPPAVRERHPMFGPGAVLPASGADVPPGGAASLTFSHLYQKPAPGTSGAGFVSFPSIIIWRNEIN